jgi:hypothetical protein
MRAHTPTDPLVSFPQHCIRKKCDEREPMKIDATIFPCPLSYYRKRVGMKKEAARKRPESREETPKEGIRRQVAAP